MIDILQEAAPARGDLARLFRISIEVVFNVPTRRVDFLNRVGAAMQQLPEAVGILRAAGETTAQPHDGDRFRRRLRGGLQRRCLQRVDFFLQFQGEQGQTFWR